MFGFLGGHMRVKAALTLYKNGQADTFVFSSGVSAKSKDMYGADVPSDASVYCQDFLSQLDGPAPTIILEERSFNTSSNIIESLAIIRNHAWRRVAVLSSNYHIPRIRALFNMICKNNPLATELVFLGAEDVVKEFEPGVYDAEIDAAYASPEGQKRLENEARGLKSIKDGIYVLGEFQHHQRTTVPTR